MSCLFVCFISSLAWDTQSVDNTINHLFFLEAQGNQNKRIRIREINLIQSKINSGTNHVKIHCACEAFTKHGPAPGLLLTTKGLSAMSLLLIFSNKMSYANAGFLFCVFDPFFMIFIFF